MKIISKFQDYYDSALAFGIDPNLMYLRETNEDLETDYIIPNMEFNTSIDFDNRRYLSQRSNNFYDDPELYEGDNFIVGFCGELYTGVHISLYHSYESVDHYIYTKKHLDSLISENKNVEQYFHRQRYGNSKYDGIVEFLEMNPIEDTKLFYELSQPVFIAKIKRYGWGDPRPLLYDLIVNPELKQYNFAKVIDPYTAFQRLSMFIGNGIGTPAIDLVQIDDVHLRDAKGFNNRSFKKDPTKKRR